MKRIILGLAGVALVASLVGLSMFSSSQPEPVKVPPYLEKASGETILPPHSRQEVQRRVQFAADGFTRERMVVYFVNGDTGVTIYNPDGTLDVYKYHPSETPIDWKARKLSDSGLKSMLKMAKDGVTVSLEQHWYPDGKLKRLGQRLPAGGFQADNFYEDGAVLSERSFYTAKGQLESRSEFYPTGSVKSTLKLQHSGLYKDWVGYFPDGKKSGFHIVEGNVERGEWYYEDGTTVRVKFKKELLWQNFRGYSLVTAEYMNPDGSLNHTRTWDINGMKAIYPATATRVGYTQTWRVIDAKRTQNRLAADNHVFVQVTVSSLDGISNVDVYLDKDRVPVEIRFTRKSTEQRLDDRIIRTLRPDGTVSKEVVMSSTKGRTETEFSGNAGGRVHVPDYVLKDNPFEAPPSVPVDLNYPTRYY